MHDSGRRVVVFFSFFAERSSTSRGLRDVVVSPPCVGIREGKSYEKGRTFHASVVPVRISVRQYFILSERMIDATSILARELEAQPV
jgi:hypothetical protein